jgi:APA family basic amino acid/polyamine antiporter
MSGKADNPTKTVPRALMLTLLSAALLSGLAQMSLAWMVPEDAMGESTSFEEMLHERKWMTMYWVTSVGECILMPLVVLVCMLPQSELTAAMSEDKLLPSLFSRVSRNGVFIRGTAIIGMLTTVIAFATPFSVLWNMISIGVLVGFQLTNASLINIRYGNGGELRNRKVARLTFGLLVSTALSAYPLWLCYMSPTFAGEDISMAGTVCGVFFFLVSIGIMVMIMGNKVVEQDREIYSAPGVPIVPGFAMIINYILMAGMSFSDHMYFVGSLCFFVFAYLVYTGRGTK